MVYKWYDTYHNFFLLVCPGSILALGVNLGSMLVDFGVRESTF